MFDQKKVSENVKYENFILRSFVSGSVDWKPTKQLNSRLSPEPSPISEEKLREIMDRESVWVSDPVEGFVLGRIVDIGEDGATVEPFDRKKKPVVARYERSTVCMP